MHARFRRIATFVGLLLAMLPLHAAAQITWHQVTGLEGGYPNCLVVIGDSVLIAGTDHGIYRSVDDGAAWSFIGLGPIAINDLERDSSGIVLAATSFGLYGSNDDGRSWRLILPDTRLVSDVAILRRGTWAIIQVGTMYRTTDSGATWAPVDLIGRGGLLRMATVPGNDTLLYAISPFEVFRSQDTGITWDGFDEVPTVASGDPPPHIKAIVVPRDSEVLVLRDYALYHCGTPMDMEFTRVLNAVKAIAVRGTEVIASRLGGPPTRSVDYGANWDSIGTLKLYLMSLMSTAPGTYYGIGGIGNDAGVVVTHDDGASWRVGNAGLRVAGVGAMLALPDGSVICSYGGVIRTTDRGATWSTISGTGLSWMGRMRDGVIGFLGSRVYWSSNGFQWSPRDVIADSISGPVSEVFAVWGDGPDLMLASTGNSLEVPEVLFHARGALMRSTDGGATWRSTSVNHIDITSIVEAPDGALYAAGGTGAWREVYMGDDGVFRSTDRGASWVRLDSTPKELRTPTLLVTSSGTLLLASSSGKGETFRSSDRGVSWKSILPDVVTSLVTNRDGVLYAGTTTSGVLRSTDDGLTWVPQSDGLTTRYVTSLALDTGSVLFAGTSYASIFVSDGPTASLRAEPANMPREIAILPNPSRDRALLTLDVARPVAGRLLVVDLLGRAVIDREIALRSGANRIDLETADLAPGAYIVTVEAGELVASVPLRRAP